MVITMKPDATSEQLDRLVARILEFGLRSHEIIGEFRTVIAVIGDDAKLNGIPLEAFPGVEKATRILAPYQLASRKIKPRGTVVYVRPDIGIGHNEIILMAGPCAIESSYQIVKIARLVRKAGAKMLRGGAFKPRTTPYSFQGHGIRGLQMMALAREETGLALITEVMDPRDVGPVSEVVDVLQVGARNMQNFDLLKEIGLTRKPVMIKRGLSATIEELLFSAEYVLSGGNPNVILCERGIRTFETHTRNTLDLSAIPAVKELSHLPIIVDPSHGTGRRSLVVPMARAAIAAGADGLIVEVHHDPENSMTSDGKQSLLPSQFLDLIEQLVPLAEIMGRKIQNPTYKE